MTTGDELRTAADRITPHTTLTPEATRRLQTWLDHTALDLDTAETEMGTTLANADTIPALNFARAILEAK